ncbi:MAG: hypothetical protein DRO99_01115 [Candidatus Aenigmatarchaeota archaeon]|nr:MAG: hypothetical protein DRO99_01115 [Candidatus Aenigmarchaeota archaeon]
MAPGKRGARFVAAVSAIAGIGYFLFSIMESSMLSESQKYFGLTLVLFVLLIVYIETVVRK